jgi:hypothetical protein
VSGYVSKEKGSLGGQAACRKAEDHRTWGKFCFIGLGRDYTGFIEEVKNEFGL